MTKAPDDPLLFGRFTREECGLPPVGPDRFGERLGVLRPALLLILLAALGWFAGRIMANARETWVASLPAVMAHEDPEERSKLMARGRMYATALPDHPAMRLHLAVAAMTAADLAPRRAGYLANAREILANRSPRTMRREQPAEAFFAWLALAGLREETGEYPAAFAALEEAEKALSAVADGEPRRSLALVLANTRAWLLATAPREAGGDAGRALELAGLAISSRDALPDGRRPSESSALLDTLAMARFKNGLRREAVAAQSLALGMADPRALDVYVRNFDLFSNGK